MQFQTKHFTIINSLDKELVLEFSRLVEEKYKEVQKAFYFLREPEKRIKITLCKTFKEYHPYIKNLSWWRWSQGCGDFEQGIVLNLKRIREMGNFDKGSYSFINSPYNLNNVGHELSHVFTEQFFYGNEDFPAWLNEGLAEYFGAGKRKIKKIKTLINFSEIKGYQVLPTDEAYNQAMNMVILLVKKYGEDKLIIFLKNCLKLKDFNSAFNRTYKITFHDFENSFLNYLTKLKN